MRKIYRLLLINFAINIVSCSTKISEEDIIGLWESSEDPYVFEFRSGGKCIIHNVPDSIVYNFWSMQMDARYAPKGKNITIPAKWYIFHPDMTWMKLDLYDDILYVVYKEERDSFAIRAWGLELDKDIFGRKEHNILFFREDANPDELEYPGKKHEFHLTENRVKRKVQEASKKRRDWLGI